jgi:C-terminal processing protease CtpA/Prc
MRRSLLIAFLATGGAAGSLLASPQTGSGSSTPSQSGSTVTVRTRCADCSAREEARVRRKLEAKIDSIRWEFDHSKLTQAERNRLAESLDETLQNLMELDIQSSGVATAVARAEAGVTASRAASAARAPMAMAYTIFTAPRGYIGVTFDAPWTEDVSRNGDRVVRFYRYPRIALVEPESPADKAGVLEGDTLLSINDDDVKESAIPFGKLLVPDNRILLRVRREGDSKELKLIVGEAPNYYASRMTTVPVPPRGPMAVRVRTPMSPMAAMPAQPAGEAAPGFVTVWTTNEAVAGAKLQTISEGLGKAVGVKNGVLVLSAAPGTPAYKSGLRDGDVILRAGGEQVSAVRDFRMLVQDADKEDGIRVVIIRDKKQKEITLRW